MPELNWRDVIQLLTGAVLISGIVIAWVKYRLAGDFASRQDIQQVATRLGEMERTVALAPTHTDFAALSGRIGVVEGGVGAVRAELHGIRDGQRRIEGDLQIIKEHLLRGDR